MRNLTIPTIIFDSAHYIPGYDGACANVHGHSYIVEDLILSVEGELDEQGISIDFGNISGYFKKEWDHKLLVPEEHFGMWRRLYGDLGMQVGAIKSLKYTTCEHISDLIIEDFMKLDRVVQVGFTIYEGASEGSGGEHKFKSRQEDFEE